jgi:Holliday junction resolvasome RuvABC endonuclease subunit
VSAQLELGGGRPSGRPSILALDLSLTCTGVCLNGEPSRITSRQKGYDRLTELTHDIYRLTFGVDVVVIEDFSFGSKGSSLYQIAGLGYIVRLWLYEHDVTTVLISPATLKKFATGKGNSPKDAMIAAAVRRFHLGEGHDDNNEVDAYLLWCMAREAYGGPIAKLPAAQAAVAHALNWPRIGRRDAA